jgi:hypothetical protein
LSLFFLLLLPFQSGFSSFFRVLESRRHRACFLERSVDLHEEVARAEE